MFEQFMREYRSALVFEDDLALALSWHKNGYREEGTNSAMKRSGQFQTLDDLPLFASEEQLANAILGPGKLVDWRGISKMMEDRGLPYIDAFHGGRYVPAVRRFYDAMYGVNDNGGKMPAREPHRPADLNAPWKKRDLRRLNSRPTK
jgi:hypothetical protein